MIKLSHSDCYKIIKDAKEHFWNDNQFIDNKIQDIDYGLCHYIKESLVSFVEDKNNVLYPRFAKYKLSDEARSYVLKYIENTLYEDLNIFIPIFNRKFLEVDEDHLITNHFWTVKGKKAVILRMSALDKMLDYYKSKKNLEV